MLVIDCFAVFVCVVCALDMHACKAFCKHDIEMGYLLFVNIALKWNVSCVIVPKGEIPRSKDFHLSAHHHNSPNPIAPLYRLV